VHLLDQCGTQRTIQTRILMLLKNQMFHKQYSGILEQQVFINNINSYEKYF
jgi:hypothetical protein